ncbi:hypothetical protein [Kingella oralis]|uniref:hypothetical protein n=1 Tax=Kingella oralis TaxID=505 RepID=UPI002D7E2B8B|nr:hypothetical protein [Kingella oralis]
MRHFVYTPIGSLKPHSPIHNTVAPFQAASTSPHYTHSHIPKPCTTYSSPPLPNFPLCATP